MRAFAKFSLLDDRGEEPVEIYKGACAENVHTAILCLQILGTMSYALQYAYITVGRVNRCGRQIEFIARKWSHSFRR